MRDPARIPRIVELLEKVSALDNESLDFGQLIQKWVFAKAFEERGDIFHCEDTGTEERLQQAVELLSSKNQEKELSNDRIVILRAIHQVWGQVPDQRLGQLLSNYFFRYSEKMVWQQTDKDLVENLPQAV
eukprot:TRINITY_DN3392_c0_g1_i1.p1 TRINITY_DN3392_c0_g1~~TRINITY_DN3392_c0_g1_i1.p1  ORF type:complete len:130 (+),score=19.68 TRINITY_DN3392_c0_g1_i1:365-754(+)